MTLNELNQIRNHLEWLRDSQNRPSKIYKKEILKSIWIIQREIELKTKCTETKYSHREE